MTKKNQVQPGEIIILLLQPGLSQDKADDILRTCNLLEGVMAHERTDQLFEGQVLKAWKRLIWNDLGGKLWDVFHCEMENLDKQLTGKEKP